MDKSFHLVESKGMPRISMYFNKVLLPFIFKITVCVCTSMCICACIHMFESRGKFAIFDSLLSIHGFLHQTQIIRHGDEYI